MSAQILPFTPRNNPSAVVRDGAVGAILFFTGVRYERYDEILHHEHARKPVIGQPLVHAAGH